jgi:hypothetical protein
VIPIFSFIKLRVKERELVYILLTCFRISFALFILCGCVAATYPPTFINRSTQFNYKAEQDIKFRISDNIDLLKPPMVLYIPPVKWYDKNDISQKLQNELGRFIQEYFYQALLMDNYYDMILTKRSYLETYESLDYRIVTLDLAVTYIQKGSGFLRYFIGFGLGRSDIQVEGQFRQNKTDEEIMAFTMRYQHMGNAHYALNPRALSANYCLRMSIEAVALKITTLVKDVWDSLERNGTPYPLYLVAIER